MQPSLYFRLANKASAGTAKIKIPTRLLLNKFTQFDSLEFVAELGIGLCPSVPTSLRQF